MIKGFTTGLKTKTAKTVASNTVYQLSGKIVSLSVTVLSTFIITRLYGRTGYGEFNLMQNIPALFFIIADFGLNAIAVKELSKNFAKAEAYFGSILTLRIILSLFLMLIAYFGLYFFPYSNELRHGISLGLLLIVTQSLYATSNVIFQVKHKYNESAIGYILGSLLILLLVSFFAINHAPIALVNFSYVLGGVLTFVVNFYFISKHIKLKNMTLDVLLMKRLFVLSLPLGLMFIFSQINFKIDTILLSTFELPSHFGYTNTDTVAIYGLPYKIFEVILVIPTFFMNAIFPVYVKHLEENKNKFKQTFVKSIGALFVLGCLAMLIGIAFSAFSIKLLGGDDFTHSITALRLLLIGLPVFFVTQPLSWLLIVLNKQKTLPYIYLVSAVVNLILNIAYIPKYSFYASAVLTWVSELLVLALLLYFSYTAWKAYDD